MLIASIISGIAVLDLAQNAAANATKFRESIGLEVVKAKLMVGFGVVRPRTCAQDIESQPGVSPLQQIIGNASDLLGWQTSIFPTGFSGNDATGFCGDFTANSGLLPQVGVDVPIVAKIICAREGCDATTDLENILSHIAKDVSNIFTLGVIYAFQADKSTFIFLCSHLDPRRVSALTGTNDTVKYICEQAGRPNHWSLGNHLPETTPSWDGTVPFSSIANLRNNGSAIWAYEVLAITNTTSVRNALCGIWTTLPNGAVANDNIADNLKRLGLNSDVAHAIICGGDPSTQNLIPTRISELVGIASSFIAAIEFFEASADPRYRAFICAGTKQDAFVNFNEQEMEAMGLIPSVVFQYLQGACAHPGSS